SPLRRSAVFRHATHLPVLASSCLAAAVVLVACTSGAHATHTPSLTHSATPASLSGPDAVHLTHYSHNDSAHPTVIVAGAIGDYGQALSDHANGATDPEHGDQLKLVLTHGSFRLNNADMDKRIVAAFTTFPANTATCSGLVSLDGSAPIMPGSGT